jgi:uncharacterized protein (UPF0261 family)
MKKNNIVLIGSLDTKGADVEYIKNRIDRKRYNLLIVDTSIVGKHDYYSDITADEVVSAAGNDISELRRRADRGIAMDALSNGLKIVLKKLHAHHKVDAILGLGGGAGTSVCTAGMRELPIGVPKIMVTTLASGNTEVYVQETDILMFPSIVDISGINRISAGVYSRAAAALTGMLDAEQPQAAMKPLIAASMFGNTTPAVTRCKSILEQKLRAEVLIFHATGSGGKTMEALIRKAQFSGVLDITTTEIADEIIGGVMSAGPDRLSAAVDLSLPQIIVPGCLDMAVFREKERIPEKYKSRKFYNWNPDINLMRTNPAENREMAVFIAEKLNKSKKTITILLPLKGLSMLDAPGEIFWWPEANRSLFETLREKIDPRHDIIELDCNINDNLCADTIAAEFIKLYE